MALDDNIVGRRSAARPSSASLKGDVGRSKDEFRCQKPIADGFSLDARVALDERVAEQWLALRYKWDLQVLRGYRPVTPNHSGAYRLRNPRRLLVQRRPHIEALHIGEWSRFGNSVRQMLNAFFLAEELGAHTIGFPRPHLLFAGESAGDIHLTWDACELDYSVPCLVGNFFHLNAFRLSLSSSQTARLCSSLIRPLVRAEMRKPDPRVREDDLVLHFRSGDAFAGPEFPRNHGQPPLSYYLLAVERERTHARLDGVRGPRESLHQCH